MPPRIPFLSAIRPAQTYLKSQVCQFSKSAKAQGRKYNTIPCKCPSIKNS